ncbi:MAG: hypothetical protein IJ905_00920 [Fibrobacter sp.]|nr:hypothetical protein [Fibrobacter sp.]
MRLPEGYSLKSITLAREIAAYGCQMVGSVMPECKHSVATLTLSICKTDYLSRRD